MWSFDVFALNDASGDHALKFVFYELFTRYDLINRFKVCSFWQDAVYVMSTMSVTAELSIDGNVLGSTEQLLCIASTILQSNWLFLVFCWRSLFVSSYPSWTRWKWATANTRIPITTWRMRLMSHRPFITCSSRPAWWYVQGWVKAQCNTLFKSACRLPQWILQVTHHSFPTSKSNRDGMNDDWQVDNNDAIAKLVLSLTVNGWKAAWQTGALSDFGDFYWCRLLQQRKNNRRKSSVNQ